jgi:uncharacterized membrane-anchored protein
MRVKVCWIFPHCSHQDSTVRLASGKDIAYATQYLFLSEHSPASDILSRHVKERELSICKNTTISDMSRALGKDPLCKVPEVTLIFWIIKIFATTLGETGGDALSMSMHLGYLVSTGIFGLIFLIAVIVQVRAKNFHPMIYWATIVATTTVGTTMADFADRSLHIGYAGGTTILLTLLLATLFVWHRTQGSIAVGTVNCTKTEIFYWVTIMFSQTLGTALGDWTADSAGLGYTGGAIVFSVLLAAIAVAYYRTKISRVALFWAAFILTRPLGAVVGDFLDKPISHGGLALSRFAASGTLLVFMLLSIVIFSPKAAKQAH